MASPNAKPKVKRIKENRKAVDEYKRKSFHMKVGQFRDLQARKTSLFPIGKSHNLTEAFSKSEFHDETTDKTLQVFKAEMDSASAKTSTPAPPKKSMGNAITGKLSSGLTNIAFG
jgi:hypothetical protein